jgi:Cu-Zn family superoxide dismutase
MTTTKSPKLSNSASEKVIQAIAVFNDKKIKGTVHFTEEKSKSRVRIDVDLTGLKSSGLHGFHVHEYGDMSDSCDSMCAHFNPYNKTHGCPGMKERHVGDLGNLKTNAKGEAKYTFYDDVISLRGTKANIIGRGLIIHADEDDCGQGGQLDSLITGHAGKRIACSVIGYASPLKK